MHHTPSPTGGWRGGHLQPFQPGEQLVDAVLHELGVLCEGAVASLRLGTAVAQLVSLLPKLVNLVLHPAATQLRPRNYAQTYKADSPSSTTSRTSHNPQRFRDTSAVGSVWRRNNTPQADEFIVEQATRAESQWIGDLHKRGCESPSKLLVRLLKLMMAQHFARVPEFETKGR